MTMLMACLLATMSGNMQVDADGVVYTSSRNMRVPVEMSVEDRQDLQKIQLFVSEDAGKSWLPHTSVAAKAEFVPFRAKTDGTYWLQLVAVDMQGERHPAQLDQSSPGMKLVVDTKRPEMRLRPIKSPTGQRGIRWELREENPNDATTEMAVWVNQPTSWQPYAIPDPTQRIVWFNPGEPIKQVQVYTRDKAGNEAVEQVNFIGEQYERQAPIGFALHNAKRSSFVTTKSTPLSSIPVETAFAPPGSTPGAAESSMKIPKIGVPAEMPAPAPFDAQAASYDIPPLPGVTEQSGEQPDSPEVVQADVKPEGTVYLPTSFIVVNYEVAHVRNPEFVDVVLWGTRDDGKEWVQLAVDSDQKPPIKAELDQEGLWGLKVGFVPKGESDSPAAETKPEVFIEVDTVNPYVEVGSPELVEGKVVLHWSVVDANLTTAPIKVSYSSSPKGPWTLIAEGVTQQESFAWDYTQEDLQGEVYFLVEAEDCAGNVGNAVTPAITLGGQ